MSLKSDAKVPSQEEQQRKYKVLILEDVELEAEELQSCFMKGCFDVHVAYSEKEAFQILKKQPLPDLIIIDLYMLPKKLEAGVDFVETIAHKRHEPIFTRVWGKELPPGTKDIPVLIYSNFSDYILGVPEWPQKPITMTEKGRQEYEAKEVESLLNRLRESGLPPERLHDKNRVTEKDLVKIAEDLLKQCKKGEGHEVKI